MERLGDGEIEGDGEMERRGDGEIEGDGETERLRETGRLMDWEYYIFFDINSDKKY